MWSFQYRGGRLFGSPTPPKGETRRASAPRRERGRAASSRVFATLRSAKERDVLHDAGCFHNRLSDTTSRDRTNCSACLLPRYYPRLTRCVASLLPLSQRAACELSGVGVTARQLEPRCAARARRRPRVHVPHAARTEERTRNVSRTDPAVGRAREGSRARRDGMENPFRVYGACGAPKQADSLEW